MKPVGACANKTPPGNSKKTELSANLETCDACDVTESWGLSNRNLPEDGMFLCTRLVAVASDVRTTEA